MVLNGSASGQSDTKPRRAFNIDGRSERNMSSQGNEFVRIKNSKNSSKVGGFGTQAALTSNSFASRPPVIN